MKRLTVFILTLMLLVCSRLSFAATPLIPVEELHAGMKGYAKTIIKGDTIETFPVEILGVTGNDTLGYQILIKAGGSVMERSGGIAQGMSGSPVYIDGRLAGAVAFGRTFTDSRYCFLTPIEDMLRILDKPTDTLDKPGTALLNEAEKKAEEGLIPKGTGLMAGGFTAEGFDYLQEKLKAHGLDAINAGGVGTDMPVGDLEPGSSVGVSLVRGDMTIGALGTVTWTDDKGRILAFGHPFLHRGDTGYFMHKVWILGSLPNMQSAYKVGVLKESIGTINQDRAAGIGGKIGETPAFIPMYVSASDLDRSHNCACRVEVVDDSVLAAELMSSVVVNTAGKSMDSVVGGTASVDYTIDAVDSSGKELKVQKKNMYYSPKNIAAHLSGEMQNAVSILLRNKLENIEIRNVDMSVNLTKESLIGDIQKAVVREEKVHRGDLIHIDVVVKPYRGFPVLYTVPYRVAEDAPGKIELTVRGGASLSWLQELMQYQKLEEAAADKDKDKKKKKTHKVSMRSYVEKLNKADQNNDIIVDYTLDSVLPTEEEAEELDDFGFENLFEGSPDKAKLTTDMIIDGETTLTIKVRKSKK